MQIIIELKNAGKLNRLLELIRKTEWLSGVRVWKKTNEQAQRELVLDHGADSSPDPSPMNYREFWGCIQPQMGIATVDRLIAEMREE